MGFVEFSDAVSGYMQTIGPGPKGSDAPTRAEALDIAARADIETVPAMIKAWQADLEAADNDDDRLIAQHQIEQLQQRLAAAHARIEPPTQSVN